MTMTDFLSDLWCAPYATTLHIEGCLHPLHPGPCQGPLKRRKAAVRSRPRPPARRNAPGKKAAAPKAAPPKTPPAARAPTRGKDLTESLDYASLGNKTRRADDGNDDVLSAIAREQGFDGPPALGSRAELDALRDSGSPEMWRGMEGYADRTGGELAEQFRSGPAHYGQGIYGNGVYFSTEEKLASVYAGDAAKTGGVVRVAAHPDARVISLDEAKAGAATHATPEAARARREALDALYEAVQSAPEADKEAAYDRYQRALQGTSERERLLTDPAVWAMASGYDGYYQPVPYLGPDAREYIMFNRTALVTQRPDSETASGEPEPHARCLVELCLNPLHPGPCKGPRSGISKLKPRARKAATPKPKSGGTRKSAPPTPKPASGGTPDAKPPKPTVPGARVPGRDITGEVDFAALAAHPLGRTRDGDLRLRDMGVMQGFDGPPALVSKADMDALIADGAQPLWRGVVASPTKSAEEINDEYRKGDAYWGFGIHGNGVYFSPNENTGKYYAERRKGGLMRMALRPDAKVISLEEVRRLMGPNKEAVKAKNQAQRALFDKMIRSTPEQREAAYAEFERDSAALDALPSGGDRDYILSDSSNYAMAHGYDAITVRGEARNSGRPEDQVILLNRTAAVIEDPALDAPSPRARRTQTASAAGVRWDTVTGPGTLAFAAPAAVCMCQNPVHKGPCRKTPKPKVKCTGRGKKRKCVKIVTKPAPPKKTVVVPKPPNSTAKRSGTQPRYTGPSTRRGTGIAKGTPVVLPKGKGKNLIRAAGWGTAPGFADPQGDLSTYGQCGHDGTVHACLHPLHPGPCKGKGKATKLVSKSPRAKKTATATTTKKSTPKTTTPKTAVAKTTTPKSTTAPAAAKTRAPKGGPGTGKPRLYQSLPYDQLAKLSDFTAERSDGQLADIAKRQGFDIPPALSNRDDLDAAVRAGGTRLWTGSDDGTKSGAARAAEFRTGPARYGQSIYGNGIVAKDTKFDAERAAGSPDAVVEVVLPANAKVITRSELVKESEARTKQWSRRQRELTSKLQNARDPEQRDAALAAYRTWQQGIEGRDSVLADLGRFAAALGYDAVADRDSKGNLSRVTVLNRGALLAHDPKLDASTPAPTTPTPPAPAPSAAPGEAAPAGPAVKRVNGENISSRIKYATLAKAKTNDGTGHDARLAAVAAAQGFDGTPTVVTPEEADALVKAGGIEMWRGVSGYRPDPTKPKITAKELAEQFRTGSAHYGQGIYGNGIYAGSDGQQILKNYAGDNSDGLIRMVLAPGAKTISHRDAEQLAYEDYQKGADELTAAADKLLSVAPEERDAAYAAYQKLQAAQKDRDAVLRDTSRWAAANGYDAVVKDFVGRSQYYVLLNRTAVAVEKGK